MSVVCAFVVPGGPGQGARWQHRGVGVQHGAVGLVSHCTQQRLFGRAGLRQQGQRLVAVGGHNHFVEFFRPACSAFAAGDANAACMSFDGLHGCGQSLVCDAGNDFVDIVARATGHGPPLGSIGHLDQAMVVTKADHGGHWKLQHLIGRARPDAAHHGQKIPVAELVRKLFLQQKFRQGLQHGRFCAGFGQRRGAAVKAQDVDQHAPKAPVQQIAPLRKHAVQAGAAPLHRRFAAGRRYFDGKRHLRLGGGHTELLEQLNQVRVGALVENQKTGVYAVCHRAGSAGQADIHCVGMPAKVVAGLKQGDFGFAGQPVRCRQTGNAGADDGDPQPVGARGGMTGVRHVCPALWLCEKWRWQVGAWRA